MLIFHERVAHMVRAWDSKSGGERFESRRSVADLELFSTIFGEDLGPISDSRHINAQTHNKPRPWGTKCSAIENCRGRGEQNVPRSKARAIAR